MELVVFFVVVKRKSHSLLTNGATYSINQFLNSATPSLLSVNRASRYKGESINCFSGIGLTSQLSSMPKRFKGCFYLAIFSYNLFFVLASSSYLFNKIFPFSDSRMSLILVIWSLMVRTN